MAQTINIRVVENGRMILPLSVRKVVGLRGDTKVILTLENDVGRLSPVGHVISRAQSLYRQDAKFSPMTDDFLLERREEADREGGLTAASEHGLEAKRHLQSSTHPPSSRWCATNQVVRK